MPFFNWNWRVTINFTRTRCEVKRGPSWDGKQPQNRKKLQPIPCKEGTTCKKVNNNNTIPNIALSYNMRLNIFRFLTHWRMTHCTEQLGPSSLPIRNQFLKGLCVSHPDFTQWGAFYHPRKQVVASLIPIQLRWFFYTPSGPKKLLQLNFMP